MEFAWTLCLLAMCGGTIFHRNIWSFSKCNEKSKSIASYHNFFFNFQIHCMLQLTNLVQVITECRSCFKRGPAVRARISSPCPKTRPVRTPCVARARSCPRPCPFPLAPTVVPVGARQASVDSHLILPTASSAGNSKKSYCSKVNLEQ
jgi:hypothetical protein